MVIPGDPFGYHNLGVGVLLAPRGMLNSLDIRDVVNHPIMHNIAPAAKITLLNATMFKSRYLVLG